MFSGESIDRIIGLENVTVEVVMARAPRRRRRVRGGALPLAFRRRSRARAGRDRPGLRHVAFMVDDVRGVVDRVREAGWETVGEIVELENTFLLCYARGPEGLIVELAERLYDAPG
jgi:catechol 2,3-dioxygenase-like lactoylglutathione lyase family enzyme